MMRKTTATLCIIMALLFSCSAHAVFNELDMRARIYNCNEFVTLRSDPSTKATALERVYYGEEINLLSREVHKEGNNDFVFVVTDRNTGFILIQYLDIVIDNYYDDYYGIGYGTVSSKDPHYHTILRSGPGTEYNALGYLFGGEVIPYYGEKKKSKDGRVWYCCLLDDTICWVSSKYTELRKP